MIIKKVTTLMLSLGLIFGGVIVPLNAHAQNVEAVASCCDDGRPGDGLPW